MCARHLPESQDFSAYCKTAVSPGGYQVLIAKSASCSEFLTFDIARPFDIFFHVEHSPGAHTVLRVNEKGEKIPVEDLEFAALQAVLNSKEKKASRVSVTYTEICNVSRASGPYCGTVLVRKTRKILVRSVQESRRQGGNDG